VPCRGLAGLLIVFLHRRTDDAVIIAHLQREAPACKEQTAVGDVLRRHRSRLRMGNDAGKRKSSGSSCKIRLRPDRDSIDNAVMAATALHAAMPAAAAPTGMDTT
jgi:hypothetical protein